MSSTFDQKIKAEVKIKTVTIITITHKNCNYKSRNYKNHNYKNCNYYNYSYNNCNYKKCKTPLIWATENASKMQQKYVNIKKGMTRGSGSFWKKSPSNVLKNAKLLWFGPFQTENAPKIEKKYCQYLKRGLHPRFNIQKSTYKITDPPKKCKTPLIWATLKSNLNKIEKYFY